MTATLESLDVKLDGLCERVDRIHDDLHTINGRVRENELCVARLDERVSFLSWVDRGISAALAALAGLAAALWKR